MVTVEFEQGNQPFGLLMVATGWKLKIYRQISEVEEEKYRQLAPAFIIYDKLKGFVKQREIAYDKKGYKDSHKLSALRDLCYYMNQVNRQSNVSIYKMVVAHEVKWRLIVPAHNENMRKTMDEIISYCKTELNGLN